MIMQNQGLSHLISRAILFPLTILAFIFSLGQLWLFIHTGEPMDFILSALLGLGVATGISLAVMQQRQLIALCLQRA